MARAPPNRRRSPKSVSRSAPRHTRVQPLRPPRPLRAEANASASTAGLSVNSELKRAVDRHARLVTHHNIFPKRACGATLAMIAMVIGLAHHASAQTSPPAPSAASCYSVIAAQPGVQPTILLDRCSGRTWQLIATHRNGASEDQRSNGRYIWSPIARDEDEAAHSALPPPAAPPATDGVQPPKCFEFDGRRFCE